MATDRDIFSKQLKQTCQATGARWALWVRPTENGWSFGIGHALYRLREKALEQFLRQPKTGSWLAGALSGGRMRTKNIATLFDKLKCRQLYVFPNIEKQNAILVGADRLSDEGRAFFRVLSLHGPPEEVFSSTPEISQAKENETHQIQILKRQLQALRETALDISADLDLNVVIRRALQRIRELVDARGGEVALVREEEKIVEVVVMDNPWGIMIDPRIPFMSGVTGRVAALGEPMLVPDYSSWPGRITDIHFIKSLAAVPLKYKDKVIGVIGVADDRPERNFDAEDVQILELVAPQIAITVRNAQLYRELQESIVRLEASQRALIQAEKMATAGHLTASIAHEINNPLQSVQNCLHLAGRPELSAEQREEFLELAQSELSRLRLIIQQMMDYYRPSAIDRKLTDINNLIQLVLRLLAGQLEQKHVNLHTTLSSDIPLAFAVGDQIQQVIFNLVLNSLEAIPDGGEIFIESLATADHIFVKVEDTGPGLPQGMRGRIFEPFSSTKEGRLGLGLAVSYGIITAHGGQLEFLDLQRNGACFQITLPVRNAAFVPRQ